MPGFSLGHALRNIRAGEKHLAWNADGLDAAAVLGLTSPDFAAEGLMSKVHAGKGVGEDVSPALRWDDLSGEAKGLVLIVEDVDAPTPRPIVHLAAEFALDRQGVERGELGAETKAHGVTLHKGSLGIGYRGPRPVPNHGPHRYVFQLFALDVPLGLPAPATQGRIRSAMAGHVIARGRLDGLYVRP
jgi:Raf kinase inhibitor-like YbhB/YbcL family protein